MHQHDEECTCTYKVMYKVFRIKDSTLWGFSIGQPKKDEVNILGRFGPYKTKNEAELAACSFICGIDFALKILNQ